MREVAGRGSRGQGAGCLGGDRNTILLVVVRPDLARDDPPDDAALQVIARWSVEPADRTKEALEAIVAPLRAAAVEINTKLYTVESGEAAKEPRRTLRLTS
jgi:hypothetical protein